MSRAALWLVVFVALLFSIGLLMVFNTTSAEIIDRSLSTGERLQNLWSSELRQSPAIEMIEEGGDIVSKILKSSPDTHAALFKQIIYSLVGICVGLLVARWGYENLIRWSVPLLIGGTFLLILVFIPGFGMTVNGARRWLGLFGFPIGQPSEIIKILIPAAYIHWYLKQKTIGFISFLKILGSLSVPIALILLEPDNGTTFILLLVFFVLFLLTRIRLLYWALPLFCLSIAGAAVADHMPHVHDRIRIYLHPELDLRGKGHQPYQAKIAAGSGQILGRGLGESWQKLNYLPEARSDYIAAIYAEELGFVGVVGLIALYIAIAICGFSIAIASSQKGAFLLASTITFLISIQAFLNLGLVSGLLPSKGMTLPFFSQGGSSLLVNIVALFILLDISRKVVCLKY
jgi:cell division protein FtsW